jgi:hypothetical protein
MRVKTSDAPTRYAGPAGSSPARFALENVLQSARRDRELRDRARNAYGIVDCGCNRRSHRVDAAFAGTFDSQRIKRAGIVFCKDDHIAKTPGTALAARVSIETICPWAMFERTIRMCS